MYSIDDLIEKYLELRNGKAVMEKRFELELSPIKSAMETIENELMSRLLASGVESMRGEHGTVFKKTSMSVHTSDRQALFDFIKQTDNYQFLTAAVSKEALAEYLEGNDNVPPPGVDVSLISKVHIRRK